MFGTDSRELRSFRVVEEILCEKEETDVGQHFPILRSLQRSLEYLTRSSGQNTA
jgi:hypothetical protein